MPRLVARQLRWATVSFENYVSSGIVEVPEMEIPAHEVILRIGSPSVIEWRSKGRDHKAKLPSGSVSLLPAGLRQAARVFRPLPGVGSILQSQSERNAESTGR